MNDSAYSNDFFRAMLEGFVDGILVLTEQQEIVYANTTAYTLYPNLMNSSQTDTRHPLVQEIQRVCHALIDSRDCFPDHSLTLESELIYHETLFRISAKWLDYEVSSQHCILVGIQNQHQFLRKMAIAESHHWGLTPRETEVWTLRRLGYSRQEIATQLIIALDTVKKHLKGIQAKREAIADAAEWQSTQAS